MLHINLSPTKRQILQVLAKLDEGETLKTGEIVDEVNYGKRSTLNNLKELEEENLIKREKIGREIHTRLNYEHLDIVSGITKQKQDGRSIAQTNPQNISVNLTREEGDNYSSAIYRSLGNKSLFNQKITVEEEEKLSIEVLLSKIIDKLEERQRKELKKYTANMFEELIEEYEVHKIIADTNKQSIINTVFNAVNGENESHNDFDYGHLPALSERPEYILLIHSPAVIMAASDGTVSMEDIEEAREIIEQDLKKMEEGKPVLGKPSEKRMSKAMEIVDVFTEQETEFFQQLFKKVSERKQGEPILTITKSDSLPYALIKKMKAKNGE